MNRRWLRRIPEHLGWRAALLAALMLIPRFGLVAQQPEEPQAPTDTTKVVPLEPIEVWVVREKSQARRAETFSLFTEGELRHSEQMSPYEFFKRAPGLNLVQGLVLGYGLRNPAAGRVQIRGAGRRAGPIEIRSRGVLLLTDGVPDFSVTHGHPLPDIFSRSFVNEIEVIKGPSSVRHGWAQAGVILQRSLDPDKLGSSGYMASSLGSYSTTQNLASYNYRWDRGFVQLSGSLRHSDGHRPTSEVNAYDGRVRLAQKLGDGVSLVASFRGGTNDWQVPGPVGGQPGVGGDNDWFSTDVGLRGSVDGWDITGKVWLFDAMVTFEDGLKEPNEAWGSRLKAESTVWSGGSLTLGTDFMNYSVGRGTGDVETIDFTAEVAPYVWLNQQLGEGDRWILSGGARLTVNEQFGEHFSPEVGLVFRPTSRTALRTRLANGFRAPNAFEFAFGSTANPDLEASSVWQYEVGWNQQLGGHVELDVVGWLQDGSNMIRTVFDSTVQDTRFQNTGEFTHVGVEAQVEASFAKGFYAGLAGTAMDLEDDTALVPLYTIDIWSGWSHGAFWTRFDGRWALELYQRDGKEQRLPNYFVANLGTGYRLSNGVGFRVRAENLFDEFYELFAGWPMPGISVFGGLDFEL